VLPMVTELHAKGMSAPAIDRAAGRDTARGHMDAAAGARTVEEGRACCAQGALTQTSLRDRDITPRAAAFPMRNA
jgi:hypothetical protein